MSAHGTTPRRVSERALAVVLATVGCTLVPRAAAAHLVTTGLGPVYDGISHVLVSFDDLLPIIAMALVAGLNGRPASRRALFALTGSWLVGGVAGFLAGSSVIPAAATATSFLALGVLAAIDRRLSLVVVTAIAIAVGLLHGWLNGAAIAASQREALGLLGIAGTAFILVALVTAVTVSVQAAWARVAIRVAGSWIAAIGLLMLGWSLRAV